MNLEEIDWSMKVGHKIEDKYQTVIQLGIDGNEGFALLGEDITTGESEFVEINYLNYIDTYYSEKLAMAKAFELLKNRLNIDEIGYNFI